MLHPEVKNFCKLLDRTKMNPVHLKIISHMQKKRTKASNKGNTLNKCSMILTKINRKCRWTSMVTISKMRIKWNWCKTLIQWLTMKEKWDNLKRINRIFIKTKSASGTLSVKQLEVSLTSNLMTEFSITFKAERLEAQVDLNSPTEWSIWITDNIKKVA